MALNDNFNSYPNIISTSATTSISSNFITINSSAISSNSIYCNNVMWNDSNVMYNEQRKKHIPIKQINIGQFWQADNRIFYIFDYVLDSDFNKSFHNEYTRWECIELPKDERSYNVDSSVTHLGQYDFDLSMELLADNYEEFIKLKNITNKDIETKQLWKNKKSNEYVVITSVNDKFGYKLDFFAKLYRYQYEFEYSKRSVMKSYEGVLSKFELNYFYEYVSSNYKIYFNLSSINKRINTIICE